MNHVASPAPSKQAQPVILYVEDDDINWEVAELRLGRRYQLHRARDAREACKQLVALRDVLSIVLMDIHLEGSDLDGLQLTRMINGRLPPEQLPPYAQKLERFDVPVVFVSANEAALSDPDLLRTGASFAIRKPVDFVQLTAGINKMVLERRTRALNAAKH